MKNGLPQGVVLKRGAHAVQLELPIKREDDEVVAWARLLFTEHEPIVIDVKVCSLDGVPVLERAVQREDVVAALTREVWCASARIRPLNRTEVAFEFLEPGVRLQMDLPRIAVEQFLRAGEAIVKIGDEDRAMTGAVERLLRLTGVSADSPF